MALQLRHNNGSVAIPETVVRHVGGFDNGPCLPCVTETPCKCNGGPCACTCGRCLYPYPLDDDGPLR